MQKQYLTEENYQRINKKFKTISLTVFIIGLIIGLGLIVFGVVKTNEINRTNEERAAAAVAESEASVATAKEKLSEIEAELSGLEAQYDAKASECDSLDMADDDWFAKSGKCQREEMALQTKIAELQSSQFQIKNADYTVYYQEDDLFVSYILYGAGGFIILASAGIALAIWLITKRRALLAYHAQSVMPVAKEGIDEITPTVANSAGNIADSVAEGIARGIKKGKE
ncbi:hypothetical protein IKF02_00945 [Candidatus Saccharibacteria bacterium]|nr:hypothetical protein [Candidatus Saccharibacteria bacterium]MBR3143798.1 hypothetical protein [Candidatus Saccharibacteria bacterium]